MKLLPLLFILGSVTNFVYADEGCIFNESAYIDFIKKYSAENKNSEIESNAKILIVNKNNEKIVIKGGGCVHLGMAIESKTEQSYSEEQFLQKVLDLSIEFGSWLINTRALKDSIKKGKYKKIDDAYYIQVDAMTVFSASYNNQGQINIDFYIN